MIETENISSVKKAFEAELNEMFQKYNKMVEGKAILLVGNRCFTTGLYSIDGFESRPGATFKDLYILRTLKPVCSCNLCSQELKTG
mgnify:CR=1 FL=1